MHMKPPIVGARMLGPLPAESTPLPSGARPVHILKPDLNVAPPTPGGTEASHHRIPRDSAAANPATCLGSRMSACAVSKACSVSSPTMPPRPGRNVYPATVPPTGCTGPSRASTRARDRPS